MPLLLDGDRVGSESTQIELCFNASTRHTLGVELLPTGALSRTGHFFSFDVLAPIPKFIYTKRVVHWPGYDSRPDLSDV